MNNSLAQNQADATLAAPAQRAERRVTLVRLLVWSGVTLASLAYFRADAPWAWRAAAFAVLYTLLALFLPRQEVRSRIANGLDIAVELVAATVVIAQTGGISSPFAALYFITTGESFVLFGTRGAISAALAASAMGLVNLRAGVTIHAAITYGLATGLLILAAALLGVAEVGQTRRNATVLKPRTVEDVEKQVEALEEQNRQVRASYRDMAAALREQKAKLEDLHVRHRLLAVSIEGEDPGALYEQMLRVLAETFDGSGAALWLVNARGDQADIKAVVGQVAPLIRESPIPIGEEMQPSDVRRACEERLQIASPVPPPSPPPVPASEEILDAPSEQGPVVLGVTLRDEEGPRGVLAVSGAHSGLFAPDDAARLAAFASTIHLAVTNIERHARLNRNVHEISVLHEMSNLVQATTKPEELYAAVVELVGKMIPYENCTVFLLDATQKKLEAKVTRGRAVNLIEHIPFEQGSGISGWVAQQKKQVFIADLARERLLLNVELIPPQVRSFVSVPMVVQESVIGVLNVSHSQPHAFAPEDMRLLAILASQAAITIERTKVMRSLEQMAITDELTRVYNHRYFQLRLTEELKRARRYHLPVTLMMIDIDFFKQVNDRFGHGTGNTALAEMAALLRQTVRETEIVARYGGEEFAVILPLTNAPEAAVAAERLRRTVEERAFQTGDGAALRLTISVGLASFPQHADTTEALIQQADAALYAAKQDGRNQVRFAAET